MFATRAALAVILISLAGCATQPKVIQSQMEIQAYQSQEFSTTKRIAFDSTMSVLQDNGFIIESADYDTGFITGKGSSKSRYHLVYGSVNEHVEMTAFVESRTAQTSRVRINIVASEQRKSVMNVAQDVINQQGIRDPVAYQKLFERIDQAVFIKQNL